MNGGTATPPRQRRILAVDDDPSIHRLVATILRRAGYEVVTAASGAAALFSIGEQHFDAVVLDLMMPEMSGIDLLQKLRSSPARVPPVVVMSAAPIEVVERVAQLGVSSTLAKPFAMGDLIDAVHAAIAESESAEERREVVIVVDALRTQSAPLDREDEMETSGSKFVESSREKGEEP